MDAQQKQQILQQVSDAKNVLVAVNANPTVDELAASIGLTLMLNKMDKHATTVFSGVVPSTIEFLQPEQTIETTTDSLRDFIIALDKAKADKLRYKVEDDVVRIFITPYRTSITEKDLEFTQGDFNVDVVIALGVTRREDLDKAITAHGRILHDATVMSLTNRDNVSELGSVHWQEAQASSLCEMVAVMANDLKVQDIDGQMATALLTGIIAETDRFRNEKTTPTALSLSSQLMSYGANQQLIADKLEEAAEGSPLPLHQSEDELQPIEEERQSAESEPGELAISHDEDDAAADDQEIDKIHIDEHGNLGAAAEGDGPEQQAPEPQDEATTEPLPEEPVNDQAPEELPSSDQAGDASPPESPTSDSGGHEDRPTLQQPDSTQTPMLSHGKTIQPPESAIDPDAPPKTDKPFDLQEALQTDGVPQQIQPSQPSESQAQPQEASAVPPPPIATPAPQDSLTALEEAIGSPHAQGQSSVPPAATPPSPDPAAAPTEEPATPTAAPMPPPPVDAARDAVADAAAAQPPQFPSPQEAVGAQNVNLDPPKPLATTEEEVQADDKKDSGDSPPPVPPPMAPQFYDADGSNNNPFLNPPPQQ